MKSIIDRLEEKALAGGRLTAAEGLRLFAEGMREPWRLFAAASRVRERFFGNRIGLCGIVNAKSGRCPEDCAFCAQSARYRTAAPVYTFLPAARIVEAARAAAAAGVSRFGIVTSGKRIASAREWRGLLAAVGGVAGLGLGACASPGIVDAARARELKAAGLSRYHHNLETGRSFFPSICTTHAYDEDVAAVAAAKEAGLSTCCGGLFGMGEEPRHRVELALAIRALDVDSVPLNFLDPIPGTPLAGAAPLAPVEALATIALFRLMLPAKDIRLCGGKEKTLRQLLPLSIVAGASSLMTGDYLTTPGRSPRLDGEMIRDLGCVPG